jgi:hypothetical protein
VKTQTIKSIFTTIIIILSFIFITATCSQSKFHQEDTCADIIKKYDPFKEDSVLQTKTERMGKLFFKFLLDQKDKITLQIKFYTYSSNIFNAGEYFYINLSDSTVIKLMLKDDSYPGIAGRNYFVHVLSFVLNDITYLQKLKHFFILSARLASYNFDDLTNQKKFMENLNCIMGYVR